MATNFTQYGPWVSGQVIQTVLPAGLAGAIFTIPPGVKLAQIHGWGGVTGGAPAINAFFNGNAATREVYIVHYNNAGVGTTAGPTTGQVLNGYTAAMEFTVDLLCTSAASRKNAKLLTSFDDAANISGVFISEATWANAAQLSTFELRIGGGQLWRADSEFVLTFIM